MEFALLGGISFASDQIISQFTFPTIYDSTRKIGESVPAAINGSVLGLSAYVATQLILNNRLLPAEMAGVVAGISAVQLLGGMTVYYPLVSQFPELSPYLGSLMTVMGALGGLLLIQYLM